MGRKTLAGLTSFGEHDVARQQQSPPEEPAPCDVTLTGVAGRFTAQQLAQALHHHGVKGEITLKLRNKAHEVVSERKLELACRVRNGLQVAYLCKLNGEEVDFASLKLAEVKALAALVIERECAHRLPRNHTAQPAWSSQQAAAAS